MTSEDKITTYCALCGNTVQSYSLQQIKKVMWGHKSVVTLFVFGFRIAKRLNSFI